ncbi:YbbR-like domain-containing protein [Desulfosediminicola flagellatus]|uniref:CdaR family protein n=1 Tax=Desulfosediminicola flagellatus TaxID=2569541 RepID=UPI0010AD6F4E|nr:CdaR family protein [Desulfosediminicola flagellatus]
MEKLVLKKVSRFLRGVFSARKWQAIWAKDWVLKGVSLVLATMLWYFVAGEDTVDKNVMVPIEIINLPRDLVISNQFKKEIELTVSGPRSVIQDMANKGLTRQINLSDAIPGTKVVQNSNDAIKVPNGITVLRIQPSSIILSLDKLIQKQFQVMPVTTGDVAMGFVLEKMQMNPDEITITGPETLLSFADALLTDIIDINGMNESRQIQVPLDLDPSIVDLIGETSVTADIVIRPKTVEKKISDMEVVAYVGGSQRIVTPATVDVIANVPVLLMRKKIDLKELLSVTAIAGDLDDDFLKVSVIPREDTELPIEILSVVPDSVKLVRLPESLNENSRTSLDDNGDDEEVLDEPTEDNHELDLQAIRESVSVVDKNGIVKLQAIKKKIKIEE